MKKQRHATINPHQKGQSTKTRKQLRKQKKLQKKERKKQFFQSRSHNHHLQKPLSNTNKIKAAAPIKKNLSVPASQPQIANKIKKTIAKNNQKPSKNTTKSLQQTEEDKMIRLYEQKLGIHTGKDKYSKIAKKLNMDDDLFDFLDGISNKIHNPEPYEYSQQQQLSQEEHQAIEDQNQQHQRSKKIQKFGSMMAEQGDHRNQEEIYSSASNDQFDNEYDQMFNNLEEYDRQFVDKEDPQPQLQETNIKGIQQHPETSKLGNKPNKLNAKQNKNDTNPSQIQIKKSLTRLLNKLSDGNILFTFRQSLKLFDSYSKSVTIPIYAQLYTKFNLLIQKPLFHILATNVALLAALHYAFGNRLVGPVLHHVTKTYLSVNQQDENKGEIIELGYSKRFQRLKNYATIVSLLYNYGGISGEFIQSYVNWLTRSLNKSNIELIYVIIQKCGIKIRQKDPSALKNIITAIKQSIQSYKKQCKNEDELMQKIKFIELELNEIRFNKKTQTTIDQRMAFLQTFINKNIQKQLSKEKEVFPLTFQQLIIVDTSRTIWWEHHIGQDNNNQHRDLQGEEENNRVITKQKQQLLQLAKSFHMVTEAKKNIFLCLMDSKDYLQATQRILQLNLKNHQDVATVLVEVCTLQPNFNPYYPLIAAKMANLTPKFRLNLQYAIWDHLKLLSQYQLRRTSNLAKFAAKLISDSTSNCSLSILKFYPDLSNVQPIDTTFLHIFFTHFFKKVKKEHLSKLVSKLREQNNRDIKLGIKQFLSDFEYDESIKNKVKLCRRLLMVELDERKLQQGDDE